MILLPAVVAGFIAGLARAIIRKRRYQAPTLRLWWLVLLAYLPQYVAFYWPVTRSALPDEVVPVVQIGSLTLLLVFAVLNLKQPGFWALGLGLALNLLVVVVNGGFMPITPETIYRLAPEIPRDRWQPGMRLGTGKDMVLLQGDTKLWFLSDILIIPGFLTYAFSPGDVLIAVGAFWLLWSLGGPSRITKEQTS
jgi:hypothetical protein